MKQHLKSYNPFGQYCGCLCGWLDSVRDGEEHGEHLERFEDHVMVSGLVLCWD